ncbi:MAG TPA: MFS transporter [Jatrophihabitans sp.]|nr:MFS transporter [Jatrophihabitans sp.]
MREFRLLWLAGAQSSAGDQLARIAIVLLVYARSHSAVASATTYALTFLPSLVGGVFLSGLADRYPRRTVMVTCDLVRLLLLVAMASASLSTPVIDVILVLLVLVGAPFSAASVAVLPDVLPARHYVAGVSLTVVTRQLAQLLAFAGGGVCVAFLGVRTTLLIDAATFAVSAALLRYGLADRAVTEASAGEATGRQSYLGRLAGGMRVIYRDPLLRCLVLFAWFPVFFIVPEAIAPAYARSLGGGATATGLLMAAMPAGTVIGTWTFGRRGSDAARARAVPYLAAAGSAMLLVSWFSRALVVSLLLWLLCGLFSAFQISVMTRFVRRTPAHLRGQAVGLGSAGLITAQGVGSLAAGVLGSVWSPAAAVGMAGVAGVLSVAALVAPLRHAERHAAQEQPGATTTAYSGRAALSTTE